MRPRKALQRALHIAVVAVIAGACAAAPTVTGSPTPSAAVASSSPTSGPGPTGAQPSPAQIASPSPAGMPSPTPAPSPVPIPPLTQTFRSPTMGYTVRYPAGWMVIPATKRWLSGAPDGFDAPNGDDIESTLAGFRGGSQPLAAGQTAAQWIHAYMATQDPNCGQFRQQIPLGRCRATLGLNGCPGEGRLGGTIFDLVVVVGRRAYNFTTEGEIDRAFLMALLATITFEPASARG